MEQANFAGITAAFTSGLLTATGAETVYDTTVTIVYAIDGVLYTKTAVTDGVTPTTDINTGATFAALEPDKACCFVWMVNAGGTVAVAQGPQVDVDGATDLRKVHPQYPHIPADYCPFAVQIVQTSGASSSFAFGTSNWNATGITDVIKNISGLPSRPLATATA